MTNRTTHEAVHNQPTCLNRNPRGGGGGGRREGRREGGAGDVAFRQGCLPACLGVRESLGETLRAPIRKGCLPACLEVRERVGGVGRRGGGGRARLLAHVSHDGMLGKGAC